MKISYSVQYMLKVDYNIRLKKKNSSIHDPKNGKTANK